MSKKKVLIVAGLLVAAGAVATVAAQNHRPGGHDGMGGAMMGDSSEGGMTHRGRGGMFGRSLTADENDTKAREQFARLDKNGDGFIDASEIEATLQSRMGGDRRAFAGRGEPGQLMLQRFDTDRDGKVTKDELQAQLKKRFADMDLNNDGKIDDADRPPMMRGQEGAAGASFGRGRGRGMGMDGMAAADANKDGVITLDEFIAQGMKRFDTFDRNKDGVVDKADFEALKKETADYRVKRFIHAYGADKDGKVSKEQFYSKAKERFAQMDVNGDGKITREDMPMMGRGRSGENQGGMRERMRGWFGRGDGGPAGQAGPGTGAGAQPKN
jgi:Ca2+-binding EF-hand superfamily protein